MSLKSELQALSQHTIFNLATSGIVKKGMKVVFGKEVLGVQRHKSMNRLVFSVQGDFAINSAEIWPENGRMAQDCNCGDHGDYGVCEHVVASAVVLFEILKNQDMTNGRFAGEYRARLSKDIDLALKESSESTSKKRKNEYLHAEKAQVQITLEEGRYQTVEFRGQFPESAKRKISSALPIEMNRSKFDMYRVFMPRVSEFLAYLFLESEGMYDVALRHEGRSIILTGIEESEDLGDPQIVFTTNTKGEGIAEVRFEGEEVQDKKEIFVHFPEGTEIAEDGVLSLSEGGAELLGFRDLSAPSLLALDEDEQEDLTNLGFLEEGMKPLSELEWLPGNIHVELTTNVDGGMTVDIYFVRSGTRVDVSGYAKGFFESHFTGEFVHPKMFSSKKRTDLIRSLLYGLWNCKENEEAENLVNEATNVADIARVNLEFQLKRYCSEYYSYWSSLAPEECSRMFFNEDLGSWELVGVPVRNMTLIFLSLFRSKEDSYDILYGEQGVRNISAEDVPEILPELYGACNTVGATLWVDGSSLKTVPLEFSVKVLEKDRNWFELKSEVKADGFQLDDTHWHKLIGGDLLIQTPEGMRMVEVNSLGLLQRFQSLLERGSKKKKNQISRLQIFDWLQLMKAGATVSVPKEYQKVLDSLSNFEGLNKITFPKHLDSILRDYQKKGVEWLYFLYKHRFGACLADDMGLGKTLQVITLLGMLIDKSLSSVSKVKGKHLVVVPPSLVFNWCSEFEKFYPTVKVGEYLGSKRSWSDVEDKDVIITTYDMVRRDEKVFAEHHFHTVSFDEAQNLKNIQASRTKAANKLKRAFTICLTGTPLENHVGEYFSIMNLAVPGLMEDSKTFQATLKAGDATILERASMFVLRRTKDKILKELPDKVESDMYLNMGPSQREYYTRVVGLIKEEVLDAYDTKTKSQAGIIALSALMKLRQVCISPRLLDSEYQDPEPKMDYLVDKLQELGDEGNAALVFSQFTKALDCLEFHLEKKKIPYLRMDGKTPTVKRKELVRDFQENHKAAVFLISMKTGGVGLNLTRANYVFHVDPWWNPAVENQASDRAHRMGQKNTVFIQRILMRGSVEEKMMELKKEKQKLFEDIIESSVAEQGSTLISKDQISDLLDI